MGRGETGRMLFACHCGIFAPLEQETTGGDPKYRKCDITSKFGKPIGPLTTLTTNDIQTDLFLTLTITELKFPKKGVYHQSQGHVEEAYHMYKIRSLAEYVQKLFSKNMK